MAQAATTTARAIKAGGVKREIPFAWEGRDISGWPVTDVKLKALANR